MHYDFIITGGGCAGLSLLMRLLQSPRWQHKKILLIDKAAKTANDRTWCFWETKAGLFEPVVHHSWDQLYFFSNQTERLFSIAPYRYKMIRGSDFYRHVYEYLRRFTNVTTEWGEVTAIQNTLDAAQVTVNGHRHTADYVFNSLLLNPPDLTGYYALQQHFKGWFIRTEKPLFDAGKATLMDFRVGQHHGTTFVYVLPFSSTTALIEYTLFTRDLLAPEAYDEALKDYVSRFLKTNYYAIEEQEFGVIPMTNYPFPASDGRIINLGTAGGQTKSSSGYTFQFIQKHSEKIVAALDETGKPYIKRSRSEQRFAFYDATLLHILDKRKLEGAHVFTDLFRQDDPRTVLKFLDNETSLAEDINIMKRLPKLTFAKAAWLELIQ